MKVNGHYEKSANFKGRQIYFFDDCRLLDSFVKYSRECPELPIDGKEQPFWLCKKPPRLTWLACLRMLTIVPFMGSALPLCPKTCNLPDVFADGTENRSFMTRAIDKQKDGVCMYTSIELVHTMTCGIDVKKKHFVAMTMRR
jgi:hypothetical protein